jgi:hypothetical protein
MPSTPLRPLHHRSIASNPARPTSHQTVPSAAHLPLRAETLPRQRFEDDDEMLEDYLRHHGWLPGSRNQLQNHHPLATARTRLPTPRRL